MVIDAQLPGFHRVERQAQRARHRTLARPRERITAPDRALDGLVIGGEAARAQQARCPDLFAGTAAAVTSNSATCCRACKLSGTLKTMCGRMQPTTCDS